MGNRRGRKANRNAPQANGQRRDDQARQPERRASEVTTTHAPGGAEGGSFESAVEAWTPSPLAMLDDDVFENRLVLFQRELARTERIKRAVLIEDPGDGSGDYGIIPGTQKRSLYQSGAEKFNKLSGLQPRYTRTTRYGDGVDSPHFSFEVECQLVDSNGVVHGSGGGAANNFEKKFRYRSGNLTCPVCGAETVFVSRKADSPGWFCWKAKGGCGENFGATDQRMVSQGKGVKENDDPFDLFNTVRQYADKRAYVKATRTTHALSNTFTQDVEDDPANADRDASERPAKTEQRAKASGRSPASGPQLKALRDRIAEKAKGFSDAGVTPAEIETAICADFNLKSLDELNEADVANVAKAIFGWEPPTS